MATPVQIAQLILSNKSKEKRKKNTKNILIVTLIPIGLLFFIIFSIFSILSFPITLLQSIFSQEELSYIEELRNMFSQKGEIVLKGKYPMPVDGNITSRYGYRINPVTGEKSEFHKGLDIQPTHHAPIITIADGEVVLANTKFSTYGNYIMIKHELEEETFYSLYAHLSKVNVVEGQKVTQGHIIGLEGGEPGVDINPGSSTGHHLHFEIRQTAFSDSTADPALYILGNENK